MPSVGSAAPIAAFVAITDGGRTGPAPPSASDSGRSAAEDGGGGYFVIAMPKPGVGLLAASEYLPGGGNSRERLADPVRLPSVALSEGRGRGLAPITGTPLIGAIEDADSEVASSMRSGLHRSMPESDHVCRSKLNPQGCAKIVNAAAASIFVEVAKCGREASAAIPAAPRPFRLGAHRVSPAGSRVAGRHKGGAASPGTDGGKVIGGQRATMGRSEHDGCAATAWFRCPRPAAITSLDDTKTELRGRGMTIARLGVSTGPYCAGRVEPGPMRAVTLR